jgi:hypothetical protein
VPSSAGPPAQQAPTLLGRSSTRVSFAGIHFTLEGAAESLERFVAVPRALLLDGRQPTPGQAPALAHVICRVLGGEAPGTAPDTLLRTREVDWAWDGDTGLATTPHAHVECQLHSGGARAEVSLGPGRRAAESALIALAAALLHRAGGGMLHAAAVELTGNVLACVGPSGAGKSTACRQIQGASFFSWDRLAVAPVAGTSGQVQWMAYPLPGGTPPDPGALQAGSHGRPLRGVLRVRRSHEGCRLEKCSAGQAVALLRESWFNAHRGALGELELLGRLERMARAVPVTNLYFALGASLEPPLRRWIGETGAPFRVSTHIKGVPSSDDE